MLTDDQDKIIETLVESGRYRDVSEVLRDGLRLIEQRESEELARLDGLREAAHAGFAALDRGEFKKFGSMDELQAYLNGLSEQLIGRAEG
ncbi:type II toxin-antitoxin system ParD family antitoxin [Bradyrhizobium oligotrophicum]|uniref:type II toxin-antitoxin system ParD family antitoxin n=1 Tax=Bradyrhizobium oligotrophicum TaxID=44255 RepID=UPI003EC13FD7